MALRSVASGGEVLARILPGEVELPGVSAPRGPRFSAGGSERESWRDPLAFAGLLPAR